MIDSIIICKHGTKGYSASLRFKDKSLDIDISAGNKYNIYKKIDDIMWRLHAGNYQL